MQNEGCYRVLWGTLRGKLLAVFPVKNLNFFQIWHEKRKRNASVGRIHQGEPCGASVDSLFMWEFMSFLPIGVAPHEAGNKMRNKILLLQV